jgi:intracellular sulfur oxidation DsrE/DsrF family protein
MTRAFSFKYLLSSLLVIQFAFSSNAVYAMDEDQQVVADILKYEEAPDGVVFELIGNEGDYLLNALEKVKNYKEQLHRKFPELDIALVSHGLEQFNLTRNNQIKARVAHDYVQQLVASEVPVHVCETHASWRDVTPEDFPDYITVSTTGPAQINEYQELGYILVVID